MSHNGDITTAETYSNACVGLMHDIVSATSCEMVDLLLAVTPSRLTLAPEECGVFIVFQWISIATFYVYMQAPGAYANK